MTKRQSAPKRILRGRQRNYTGRNLLQIALPMGGIRAGCICLNGFGGIQDLSIKNRPATTAWPHDAGLGGFAVLYIKGRRPITRVVEGPYPPERIYNQGLGGDGHRRIGHEGLPRFENCSFEGEYPFGYVDLADPAVPLKVNITGYSPFIPLDDRNSGIPCAILEYKLENATRKPVEFEFSYHLKHLALGAQGAKKSRNSVISGKGVLFTNTEAPTDEAFGSASLTVIGHRPKIKAMWFRGGWFDWTTVLWRELADRRFTTNAGSADRDLDGGNGGSILVAGRLKPGQTITYPILVTWYFPNSNMTHGVDEPAAAACADPACACSGAPKWQPWYTTQWGDARNVTEYVHANYASLRQRTVAFKEALFGSTLPPAVLDAVSANLGILKSPTVLRQSSGNLWAWEGCNRETGCCHGTCTHVWNYAQAMPHLYPQLERTLREQELVRSMDDRGHVQFRAALPDGPPPHNHHAAADGQLGGIMKLYRDWQICGDRAWLARMYPLARRSIDYCIQQWDPDRKGGLFEPHHNTYDIEFWGPDGMCGSIYVGALSAMAAMAKEMADQAAEAFYGELAVKAGRFLDQKLFNGEYYIQNVTWKGLRDCSFDCGAGVPPAHAGQRPAPQASASPGTPGEGRGEGPASRPTEPDEVLQLLRNEGPKYQYGSGCLSDGVIGVWMASIYGIDLPLNRANVRKSVSAIFRHNFKPDLSAHACLQRPGYAMGHEAGLLLCTWPKGGQLTLPFPYSDEVWTGIEYQVASHLIEEGMVKEGLAIVAAARARYDGHVRNPWNEYECGNYYARAMASYALLASFSGFRYSAATRTLHFGPKTRTRPFRVFFSAATGWGQIELTPSALTVRVIEGEMAVDRIVLKENRHAPVIEVRQTAAAGRPMVIPIKTGLKTAKVR